MEQIQEIQFVDLDTDAPLVTVTGDYVQVLLQESDLLKTIVEIGGQANPRVLVVPIGKMPTERQIIFANVLKGVPVGKINQWGTLIEMYPFGEKEERNIKQVVNASGPNSENTKKRMTDQERVNVIYETMRYLLIPDEIIGQMIVFDEEDTRPERDIESEIDLLLETHKKWLYLRGLDQKLTAKEHDEVKPFFDDIREKYQRNMREYERARQRQERRRYRGSWNNNDYNNYDREREIQELYEEGMDPYQYEPIQEDITGDMTVREYERWLRTVYFKKAPLGITNLTHLNTLFKNNQPANRRNRRRIGGTRRRKGRGNKKTKKHH
jgi:hypothetical protein